MDQGQIRRVDAKGHRRELWFTRLALIAILAIAAYLRFVGINWDDNTHPHPDERFLTMVESALQLPNSWGEYFDTNASKLNPHNVGHGFFVYGTLPIFIVRYLGEWVSQSDYEEIHLVGRAASASFDLISVLIVYLIGAKLYRRRVGLLAAAFSAFAVLLIQLSHFFVVDPFANTFILLGIYFAVRVWEKGQYWDYALFGLAFGMAMASKINALPLALVVVIAAGIRWLLKTEEQKASELPKVLLGLVMAGSISILAFRVFQPYAFSGPSFFGVVPNERWIANFTSLRLQMSGEVDSPPALQWAMRTPILFSLKNMVLWGMGLPLGTLAWIAYGWALWRLVQAWDWKRGGFKQPQALRHAILLSWTGIYFLWQSTGFTQSMRYHTPIYPTLILLASWAIWEAWDRVGSWKRSQWRAVGQALVGALAGLILLSTAFWAFAFVRIYQRPHTQVAASEWIYKNIPSGVNMVLEDDGEQFLQPGAVDARITLKPGLYYDLSISPDDAGQLVSVAFSPSPVDGLACGGAKLNASLYEAAERDAPLARTTYEGLIAGGEILFDFSSQDALQLQKGAAYVIRIEVHEGCPFILMSPIQLNLMAADVGRAQSVRLPRHLILVEDMPQIVSIHSLENGHLKAILIPYAQPLAMSPTALAIEIEILDRPEADAPLARAHYQQSAAITTEAHFELALNQSIPIEADKTYYLRMKLLQGGGFRLRGSVLVHETTWDMGLPFRMGGRDGFGGYYTSVNQEIYWPDDQDDDHDGVSDKLQRIVRALHEGDYIAIGTNRQYGTTTRVPIRYPLTTAYYRELFDCMGSLSVADCAARAQPGQVESRLGYELVGVFESYPTLGPLQINDQAAEEAFTVYDHPKVFIFRKNDAFSPNVVFDLLKNVDLSHVVNAPPKELGAIPPTLMLPFDRLQEQRSGGTWSEYFNRDHLINRFHPFAVVAWWVLIGLIGLLAFPITRLAFSGLAHQGYALSRLVGLVILGWGTWILASVRIPFERPTILLVITAMILASALIAWRDREGLLRYFRDHRKEILWVEALALAFFLLDLGIRLGNPDLWHPYKGGEKPMNFSYLNAVLKSSSFPAYDPWFAGGYINYYYYGYVLVGVPIKLLGIMPSIAYNLAVPTIFSLLAIGGYCIGQNLLAGKGAWLSASNLPKARIAGIVAAVALVLIGNLGTGRLIYEGMRELGGWSKEAESGIGHEIPYVLRGVARYMSGDGRWPVSIERWYWEPTRAIEAGPMEAGPINEFPFFTFLYADLHAHMISFPLTVAALAWALSWLKEASSSVRRKWLHILLALVVGGLILGALKPTNTWDYPTYWALAALAVFAAARMRRGSFLDWRMWLEAVLIVVFLIGLAQLLYQPYHLWYKQGYTAAQLWKGSKTNLGDFLVVHGVFLFFLISWMAWETREWMAATPLSALNRLRAYKGLLALAAVIFAGGLVFSVALGFPIAPVAIGVMAWAAILLLRSELPVEKRFVLVLVGTAMALAMLVEVVVLRGDISRMNTVFKFYLQVWTLLSLSSAAALIWILLDLQRWKASWRTAWSLAAAYFVLCAFLYPLTATPAKIKDRMASDAPHSLDGMRYMQYASYHDIAGPMELREDEQAIRWMQDHIQGSPVIVEGNTPEYRWGSRFTIYTGLPGVLGWNWHQRQQRGHIEGISVEERARAIARFYTTRSVEEAVAFLQKYEVEYIVLGKLEKQYYETVKPCLASGDDSLVTCDMGGRPMGMPQPEVPASDCWLIDPNDAARKLECPTHGFEKFREMQERGFLEVVFQAEETTIYRVRR